MAKYIHRFSTVQDFEDVYNREGSTGYTFECSAGTFSLSGCAYEGPMTSCMWVNAETQKKLNTIGSVPRVGVMTMEDYNTLVQEAQVICEPQDLACMFQYLADHWLGAIDGDNIDPETGMGDFIEITSVTATGIEGYKEPWVSYTDEVSGITFNKKPFRVIIKTMRSSGSSLILNDVTECFTSAITLDDLLAPTYQSYGSKRGLQAAFYLGDGETNPGSIDPENRFAYGRTCSNQGFRPSDFTVESFSPYDFTNGVFDNSVAGKVITIVWGEDFC
jgi:hypothetical protein